MVIFDVDDDKICRPVLRADTTGGQCLHDIPPPTSTDYLSVSI